MRLSEVTTQSLVRLLLAMLLASLAMAPPGAADAPAHGRAWELVTPQDTGGMQLVFVRAWGPDGDRVAYAMLGPQPGSVSGELLSHSVAVRGASGWHDEPVTVPFTVNKFQLFGTLGLAVSSDLSTWAWGSLAPLLPGAPTNPRMGAYRREPDGALTLLGDIGPVSPFSMLNFPVASADVRHLGLNSEEALVPADSGRIAGRAAYELAGTSLRLVGVDDSGQPLSPCGAVLGGGSDPATTATAMSRTGSRIFVTSPDPNAGSCPEPPAVYLREDGLETTEISASRCTRPDCGSPARSTFAGAISDGSVAYLLSSQQLTDDDTNSGEDLYRYNVQSEGLSLVSSGPPGVSAEVSSPIRVPEEGDRVYFVARGALVPGKGQEGGRNLYLSEGGQVRFIGLLGSGGLEEIAVSSDGSSALFASTAQLLPSDTDGLSDVYLYDADAGGKLTQVSLGSGGTGNGPFAATVPILSEIFPGQSYDALTADGTRAFLVTAEPLVAADVNGEPDVYEWAGGSLGLISSGAGAKATFQGASADGRSVFFSTGQSLLPQDRDGGEVDLYAARLGGGFPEPPPPPPPCEGEACLGAPPPAPQRPAVGTLSLRGSGGAKGGVGAFSVARVGPGERRELARSGRGELTVRVPEPGVVSLTAFADIGARQLVVARSRAVAKRAGGLRLALHLDAAARRVLAQPGGSLALRIVVRHSREPKARTVSFTLEGER